MGCPDETTLSDFLVGALSEERRASVLTHVEGCPSCQRALAAAEDSPRLEVPWTDPPVMLQRGALLARYVVLEPIGVGAMGVVYAAYDPELDRQVALKLLRPEGRHMEELRMRLLREAQSLARLSHPNVVAVHDVGVCGDGIFLALELVEGTTLADWVKSPRPWPEVLRIFLDAGRGLAAAHTAGLVHRDFKPANVLVGKDGRVRVTDFGLARPSNRGGPPVEAPVAVPPAPEGGADALLTRTGALLGTPAYMAPEQLMGGSADALSDQFSFCVALHEALYGLRPFEGVTPEALGEAALAGRVRPPPRDSRVPAWLRAVVLRGLSPKPEDRFPSMEVLLAALTRHPVRRVGLWATAVAFACLVGLVVGYGGAHRREVRCEQEAENLARVWGPAQRERVHQAFLATGKAYATSAWETLSAELDAHAGQWRALRTEACLAAGGSAPEAAWQTQACLDARLWQLAAITEVLENADAQTVQNAQQMISSLEGLEGCRDAPVLSTRPQPLEALRPKVDAARRKLAEARARMEAGRHADGIVLTTALLKDIASIDYRPLEAEVLLLHGHLHGMAGKLTEAEGILYRALWAAEASRDDETVARAWILLIWVVGDQLARVGEADRLAQHARAAVERLGRDRFPGIATDLHLRLGGVWLVEGRLERADEEFTEGLALSRKAYGQESLRTSYFVSGLGRVRSRQLRSAEALALYRKAQAQREAIWGPDHPGLALNLSNIAAELMSLGRREEAISVWRRSLALLEASRAADHPSLAAPLNNLGSVLRVLGRLDEAREYLTRAVAIFEHSKGTDHPNTAIALSGVGMVAYDSQHFEEALSYHRQAVERLQRALGADTSRAAPALMYMGMAQQRLGRNAEARRNLQRSVQLWEMENGPESATVGFALRPLAHLELATNTPKQAQAHCERALKLDEKAQGSESPDVALDLACIAEAQLALGSVDPAVPLLERALRVHVVASRDPLDEGWATFLLGKALAVRGGPGDAQRATERVEAARACMTKLGVRATQELKEVQGWLARQSEAPSLARHEVTP
ncbi:protein kinase [Corallococcus sp. H22C18031201]|uniref:serine/threonine-protein kinase n=1 Tax=Citreicoccus inhibens TaxID=2849499 RepID=UPI000E71B5BE|nr:serine/threonine-protein kinase [Citreicoccus inhibens]MBU8895126.1 tetratricopeptide repeat protein [Citreicoccus inhibens]RJS27272.1 protein kinase [Corallococcus sp. H22C18031201]